VHGPDDPGHKEVDKQQVYGARQPQGYVFSVFESFA